MIYLSRIAALSLGVCLLDVSPVGASIDCQFNRRVRGRKAITARAGDS